VSRVSEIDRLLIECREASTAADDECPWCGRALPAGRRRWCSDACRADFVDNHFWGHARRRALKRDRKVCQRCGRRAAQLEVHHVEPRRGRGYRSGCHHHVDMLETLCYACHVAETNAQRRGLTA
jgi:5-methylcytosine-specific restriction endonuclease McrA